MKQQTRQTRQTKQAKQTNQTNQTKQKKRRGRPPKKNSASEVIPPIRVTTEQKKKYKAAAKEAGLTLSAWLKQLADEHS